MAPTIYAYGEDEPPFTNVPLFKMPLLIKAFAPPGAVPGPVINDAFELAVTLLLAFTKVKQLRNKELS